MSVIETPVEAGSDLEEAQLLFEEARRRRRRRRLASGVALLVGILLVGSVLVVAWGHSRSAPSAPAPAPTATGAATLSAGTFSVRPVLCFAPPASASASAAVVALPTCAAASALTAANLHVVPDSGSGAGFATDLAQVPTDPQFASVASTAAGHDVTAGSVLLPGAGGTGPTRYVLGPAGVTSADVRSATVRQVDGQWAVLFHMTDAGSVHLDALTAHQFHALIAVVVDNRVISAPIGQPTQQSFTSFRGQFEVAAALTRHQADALAAQFAGGRSA